MPLFFFFFSSCLSFSFFSISKGDLFVWTFFRIPDTRLSCPPLLSAASSRPPALSLFVSLCLANCARLFLPSLSFACGVFLRSSLSLFIRRAVWSFHLCCSTVLSFPFGLTSSFFSSLRFSALLLCRLQYLQSYILYMLLAPFDKEVRELAESLQTTGRGVR